MEKMIIKNYWRSEPTYPIRKIFIGPLLEKQRKGKFLTLDERNEIKHYAENQRKKNLVNRKKK